MSVSSLGSNVTFRRGAKNFSPAPTLTGTTTLYSGFASPSFTVSNSASFVQPSYSAQVLDGTTGAVVVANSAVTKTSTTISFSTPAAGSYVLRAVAQDFGKEQSVATTLSFTVTTFSFSAATYRYFRLRSFVSATGSGNIMIAGFRLYTGTGRGGTAYPGTMTTNTAPSPYVISGKYNGYSGYEVYKAFDTDNSNTFYWTLSTPNTVAAEWVTIDCGASVTIQSAAYYQGQPSYYVSTFSLYGSATGAFAGEETLVFNSPPLIQSQGTLNPLG